MTDESTQQFRREEKEAERKKQVQAMQKTAKSHFLLVEKHRNKFRQSATGGVFINQLKREVERRYARPEVDSEPAKGSEQ